MLLASSGVVMAEDQQGNAFEFSFESIDGTETIKLESYRGKVVVLVNTASFCGFTPQYKGLENLWQSYRERGVMVLGIPSNDFGGQEPKSEQEIKNFCEGAFNISFPLTKKYRVRGPNAHEFYKWVDAITQGKGSPRWNFHKILLSADGKLSEWFASSVRPSSSKLKNAIDRELRRLDELDREPA